MKNLLIALLLIITSSIAFGQDFPFGKISYKELEMKVYDADTSASAVVLNEFEKVYFNQNWHIVYEYHTKIKILKTDALSLGNVEMWLRKHQTNVDILTSLEATVFTLVSGVMHEYKFLKKNLIYDNLNKSFKIAKAPLSNVRVGSVIEYSYTLESPFLGNFRDWDFQGPYPKIRSEFWVSYPQNYQYNIHFIGSLPLGRNENEIVKNCMPSDGTVGGFDCMSYKLGMYSVPAFVEEEYMTAKKNFISAVKFELFQANHLDGTVSKYSKEWKDVEKTLRTYPEFGAQLRKGEAILNENIKQKIASEPGSLSRAKMVYNYVKDRYIWNGVFSKYSLDGIKKAFEISKGSIGDINLSLIAALRSAGFNADPMILSTRDNGIVTDLNPVIDDFNYVVAKLNIDDKVYLLDASDKFIPFGMLPAHCLNGRGRVLSDDESFWHPINPAEKNRTVTLINLMLDNEGGLKGSLSNSYIGYSAVNKREEVKKFNSEKEYIADLDNELKTATISKHELVNLNVIDKPLVEKLDVEVEGFENINKSVCYFNPFIIGKWNVNPFKTNIRNYPVDFGMPVEEVMILNLELPSGIELVDMPEKVGLTLPNNGGRYIFDVQRNGNKLTVNHSFIISKPVFSAEEYHFLKELYSRIIQIHNADLVFKKTGL